MAAIIAKPDALNLSGNLKKFILQSSASISFVLKYGETVLLSESYEPGPDSLVTVDVSTIVKAALSFTFDTSAKSYTQVGIAGTFTATIDGTDQSFRVVRCGIARLADTAENWLKVHFLTWQPLVKPVTYYSPEWLTYYAPEACQIIATAHYDDGTTGSVTLASITAGMAETVNCQYATIAGLLGNKYPSWYEVAAYSGTTQLSEKQIYSYEQARSDDEEWFLWENSLGGIDTLRAYGVDSVKGTTDHNIFDGDSEGEYGDTIQRNHTKSTGYLDSYERLWLQDFFPARKKYAHVGGSIRGIIVTADSSTFKSSDLPSSYSFTWRIDDKSPYLNLVKESGDIPENITVPDLSAPDFIFPPRLSEYPRITLSGGTLIPAFDPNSPTATVTTFGAIKSNIVTEIEAYLAGEIAKIQITANGSGGSGSGGSGTTITIITTLSTEIASDLNVFSAARTLQEIQNSLSDAVVGINGMYLRKDINDVASGQILFVKDIGSFLYNSAIKDGYGWNINATGDIIADSLTLRNNFETNGKLSSTDFVSGFPTGTGWQLTPYTYTNTAGAEEQKYQLEIDDIIARGKLRVYEMIISQLMGEKDNFVFAGMMKVDHADTANSKIYLDTEKGETYNPFRAGDILMVQRYGGLPSAGNQYNVVKQYELQVTDAGCGSEDDGENRTDWITYTNFTGQTSDISSGDVLTRMDSATNGTRKGIVRIQTIDETAAPYIDVVYGYKTDKVNATKVRMGLLTGIKTKSGADLTGVWGLYAKGAYFENSTVVLEDGNTVEQKFEILNGTLESSVTELKTEIADNSSNILYNPTFSSTLDGWNYTEESHYITTALGDNSWVWADNTFYLDKVKGASITRDGKKNVLRLLNTTITQPNGWFVKSLDDVADGSTFSFSLYVRMLRGGSFTAGISGTELWTSQTLAASSDYQKIYITGSWNGVGDFTITTDGEAYIYKAVLSDDELADITRDLQTQITQNATDITLKASASDLNTLGQTVRSNTSAINVNAYQITLKVSQTDFNTLNQTVSNQETEISQNASNITLKASQTDFDALGQRVSNNESSISVNANNITSTVSSVSSLGSRVTGCESSITSCQSSISQNASNITLKVSKTDYTGANVVTLINQSADTVQILAKHVKIWAYNLNILRNSGNITNYNFWAVGGSSTFTSALGDIKITVGTSNWGTLLNYSVDGIILESGTQYTVSFNVIASAAVTLGVMLGADSRNLKTSFSVSANTTQRLSYTVSGDGADADYLRFFVPQPSASLTVAIGKVKIEAGPYSTEWSANPADTPYATDSDLIAKMNGTEIDGGLQLTTKIKLGQLVSGAWTEQGGISANLNSDNVMMWAGGTYAEAVAGTCPLILRHDGSGKFTGYLSLGTEATSQIQIATGWSYDDLSEPRVLISKKYSGYTTPNTCYLNSNTLEFGCLTTGTTNQGRFIIQKSGLTAYTIYASWVEEINKDSLIAGCIYKDSSGYLRVKT